MEKIKLNEEDIRYMVEQASRLIDEGLATDSLNSTDINQGDNPGNDADEEETEWYEPKYGQNMKFVDKMKDLRKIYQTTKRGVWNSGKSLLITNERESTMLSGKGSYGGKNLPKMPNSEIIPQKAFAILDGPNNNSLLISLLDKSISIRITGSQASTWKNKKTTNDSGLKGKRVDHILVYGERYPIQAGDHLTISAPVRDKDGNPTGEVRQITYRIASNNAENYRKY